MTAADLERKVRQHENDISAIYTMIADIHNTQGRHTNRFEELAEDIESLGTKVTSLGTKVTSLGSGLTSLETKVTTRMTSLETRMTSVESKLDQVLDLLQP